MPSSRSVAPSPSSSTPPSLGFDDAAAFPPRTESIPAIAVKGLTDRGAPDSFPLPPSGALPAATQGPAPLALAPLAQEGTVVITGICGRLGRRVARVLHRTRRVVGVDRRPFADKPKDIEHQQVDIRRKKLKDIFRTGEVKAVVHLGIMHDPRASAAEHHSWNVSGFAKLLDYITQFKVPKLVVLSSANVYGPQPDNAQFLTEESPLLGGQNFSDIRDLIEVDMLAQSFFWKLPTTDTVILRPVHILGAVKNAASNFLRLPTVPTLMGFDPMVQLIHEGDVVQAIEASLKPGVRGVFNLAGPPALPLSKCIKILGRRPLPVPYTVGKPLLDRLWSLHLTSFPAPELDHIRYVCMVDDQRARETFGYAPRYGVEETLRAVDLGRW